MTVTFYTRYALRALLREGQRTLLALLCIAFGVMSLVGMQLLSNMIRSAVVSDPRASLGGDALIVSREGRPFSEQELTRLESLRADGTLSAYSLGASNSARWLRPPGSGKVYLLTGQILGVDPATFPQVGEVHLRAPENASFRETIRAPMNAVITSDVADKLNLKVGDNLTLIGNPGGVPATLRLAGIADVVPGARGDSLFYSLETARALVGQPDRSIGSMAGVVNTASVLWGPKGQANSKLASADWRVQTTADQAKANAQVADLFGFMLKGAGIMGLFVGGIGVANTLQVLLARRVLEIATLKTLGYRRRDLLALFGIETALLGLAGSLVGIVAALLLALILMNLMGHLGALLLAWQVDPLVLVGGALVGVLTAVIFGLYTIVRASAVRPAVLLRDLPAKLGWGTRLAAFGLFLVLLALMTGISILIMGKLIDGLAVVGGALAGLVVLTIVMGGTLFAALSAPSPGLPMIKMARRNLKRRPMRSVFALIALFCGVFAIGLAASVILNARDRLVARQTPADNLNVTVYGKLSDSQTITAQLAKQNMETIHTSVRVPVQVTSWVSQAGNQGSASQNQSHVLDPRSLQVNYLDGRVPSDATWDITLASGQVAISADGALLPKPRSKGGQQPESASPSAKIGDTMVVQTPGASATVHIVGFYEAQSGGFGDFGSSAGGLIVSQDLAKRLGGANTSVVFVGHVPLDRLAGVTAALGEALNQTSVVSQADLNDARNHVFEGLFAFAVGLSGLALVAGAILIANAVGLAMVERRREMGILKAVGFTSGRVLGTLLVENALLGLIAGVLGMAGVGIAMIWINAQQPNALLSFDPLLAVVMIGVSVALALLSASLVAWRPTHVRPLEVLRNE